jgi:transcriptional regulator with XRE-family HTH domain
VTATEVSNKLSVRVALNARRLRTARRWSVRDLSRRLRSLGCPISPATLCGRETGSRPARVSVDELAGLAEVFGVSPADLLSEDLTVTCSNCNGEPPSGFSCCICGAVA